MSETLSAKWLKKAQSRVNGDPQFKQLGNVDTNMALKVGKSAYLINFEGFSCHGVTKIGAKDFRDADFLVEMSQAAWDKFLQGRHKGNGPTLADLDATEGFVKAADPRKKLAFFRYHLSLQAFLDAGVHAA